MTWINWSKTGSYILKKKKKKLVTYIYHSFFLSTVVLWLLNSLIMSRSINHFRLTPLIMSWCPRSLIISIDCCSRWPVFLNLILQPRVAPCSPLWCVVVPCIYPLFLHLINAIPSLLSLDLLPCFQSLHSTQLYYYDLILSSIACIEVFFHFIHPVFTARRLLI